VSDVRRHVDALAPDAVCSWVRPEQLHLTVRFLGELSDTAVSRGADAVADLVRVVNARVERVVGPAPGDPFHPHVTLARVRRPGALRASTLRQAASPVESPTMRVDAITLFESRLVPAPARHIPVVRIPLSA
jgi:2'-5' RNA ligase